MTSPPEAQRVDTTGPTITTMRQDASRAELLIGGRLDAESATSVAAATHAHLAAGRRYLRLELGNVSALDDAAAEVLSSLHRQVLGRRGTLVITGLDVACEQTLARIDATFLLLARPAASPQAR